MFFAAVHKFFN